MPAVILDDYLHIKKSNTLLPSSFTQQCVTCVVNAHNHGGFIVLHLFEYSHVFR